MAIKSSQRLWELLQKERNPLVRMLPFWRKMRRRDIDIFLNSLSGAELEEINNNLPIDYLDDLIDACSRGGVETRVVDRFVPKLIERVVRDKASHKYSVADIIVLQSKTKEIPIYKVGDVSYTALHLMVNSADGDINILKSLLENSSHEHIDFRNMHKQTAIHLAIDRGDRADFVAELLGAGASLAMLDSHGNNYLHLAIAAGRSEIAKLLIVKMRESGVNINAPAADGETPLLMAIKKGHYAVAAELIANGVSLNFRDKSGHTALHIAINTGNIELTKIITAKMAADGISPDLVKENVISPMELAITKGDFNSVKLLVEAGASLDLTAGPNKTVLNLAANSRQDEILEYLIEHVSNPTTEDILLAAAYKNGKFARKIKQLNGCSEGKIKSVVDMSRAFFYLGLAYNIGDFGMFKTVADDIMVGEIEDPEIDFEHKDKFVEAARILSGKQGSCFLDSDGNENEILKVPFRRHAAYFIVKYDESNSPCEISYCDGDLLKDSDKGVATFKIDPNKVQQVGDLNQYLGGSAVTNHKEVLDRLSGIVECDDKKNPKIISRSVPTKSQNRGNCTLKSFNIVLREILIRTDGMDFRAAGEGALAYKECRSALKEKNIGNFLEFIENGGETILPETMPQLMQFAKNIFLKSVSKKDDEVEKRVGEFLQEKGVMIENIMDNIERNALFYVVQSVDVTGVERFLRCGCDINKADKNGFTPLHVAANLDDTAVVATLLKNNASLVEKNNEGRNPLQLAIIGGHNEAAKMLVKRMLVAGLDVEEDFKVAAKFGNKVMINEFINLRVDPSGVAEVATKAGHPEVTELIVNYEKSRVVSVGASKVDVPSSVKVNSAASLSPRDVAVKVAGA